MADDDEKRNKLFDEIRNFSQRKLKKVETKVTTGSGEQLKEKRSPKGLQTVKTDGVALGFVPDTKPDLQVGMIIPGLLISSQDVAQDKSLLETYEVTHILNLAPGVPNAFEDDYNYKKIEILDVPETDITQYFEECIEFIKEGIQRGNCLVHCNAGVSRSTTICCAYLMKEKKMKYKEALATVREARAFAKPNDGFAKQLEQYEDKLFGQMAAPDSSEDKFMARKRAEIEAEKAAISGTSSVKNKLKSFGAQLESVYAQKLQSLTPIKLPLKKKTSTQPQPQPTPTKNRKKSLANNIAAAAPPPPPPPMIDSNVAPPPPPPPPMMMNDKSTKTNKIAPPPPPPSSLFQNDVANKKPVENKTTGISKKKIPKQAEQPNSVVNHQPVNVDEPPKRTAKSDYVDETPIKVAAQKKLWDSQISTNQQQQDKQIPVKNHINKTAKTTPTPAPAPQSQSVAQPQTTKQSVANKPQEKRSNKLGTWEKCSPAPAATNNTTIAAPLTASPELSKKKIVIKKKDANNNNIVQADTTTPRRATRDLAATIEAVASESNSSTPYSSPGPQRKQMHYGRRTSTQPIGGANEQQQQQPAPRKPIWGLRDQVDSLQESTPTSTPTRCRSPAVNTPRESHSPSPGPTKNKVFGRVPPRKTSLIGAGNVSTDGSGNNDMPVVSAPSTTKSNNQQSANTKTNKLKSKQEDVEPIVPKSNAAKTPAINDKRQTTEVKSNALSVTPISKNTTSITRNDVKPEPPAPPPPPEQPSTSDMRKGFQKTPLAETREKPMNRSVEARKKSKGLNRSSTKEILNLIKTKSRGDFGKSMETVDEDVEIEFLLNQLDEAGLENIDWDEIGLDEKEIHNIVEKNIDEPNNTEGSSSNQESSEEESDSESESESDDDSDDDMEHTVFKPIAPATTSVDKEKVNNLHQPKVTSTATLTLKPVSKPQPPAPSKIKVESEEDEESEEETETESD